MTIFGWDASDFDHSRGMRASHIERAQNEGIRFFTHKISEGIHVTHRHCGEKLRAAVNAGIPFVGAYAVVRTPAPSVSAQVDYAIRELTEQWAGWKSFPGFFWQVDLERWEYDSVAPKHGVEMCRLFEQKTGKVPLLYAPKWAYGDNITGDDWLWASSYGQNLVAGFRSLYPGDNSTRWGRYSGRVPMILQYGSRATIGGQRTCDANAFRGSIEQFATIIKAEVDMPLSNDDTAKIVRDVILKDGVIPAPPRDPNREKNPSWSLANVLRSNNDHARLALAGVVELSTEVNALSILVEKLLTAPAVELTPEQVTTMVQAVRAEVARPLAELEAGLKEAGAALSEIGEEDTP